MGATDHPTEAANKARAYRCFLVRCWREEAAGWPAWRFTVEQAGPHATRRSFACLEDLEAFLETQFGQTGAGS